jgi:NNP family nitrate/nitrite transporter-like MFS transporter
MRGKGLLLAGVLLLEGAGLVLFANSGNLTAAIISMLSFALFLKMSNGATYGIVPFINSKNVGMVSGIVGAGGNLGGMLFGFLFKSSTITYVQAFTYIGVAVMVVSVIVLITRFQKQTVTKEVEEPLVAVA